MPAVFVYIFWWLRSNLLSLFFFFSFGRVLKWDGCYLCPFELFNWDSLDFSLRFSAILDPADLTERLFAKWEQSRTYKVKWLCAAIIDLHLHTQLYSTERPIPVGPTTEIPLCERTSEFLKSFPSTGSVFDPVVRWKRQRFRTSLQLQQN